MFGRLVLEHRRRLALTQEELADRTGLSVRTIRDLESGRGRVPRPTSVRLLADTFGLTGADRDRFISQATRPQPQPQPQLTELARGGTVPAELPADVAAFVGRDAELASLDQLLDSDHPAVLISAVSGTAGVGKTALALRWAHRAADRFPDGQLYVNLRGYDPDEPMPVGDVLARFLGALGVPASGIPLTVDERAARFRSAMAGRRMLVVLDNAGAVDQVRPLLPGTASCAVVVTSRDSLAGLVAVNGVRRLDLDLLPATDATALLRHLIGERVDAEPDAAAALADLCDRLPLALRIAAELAASQPDTPLAKLVTDLADEGRRLGLLDIDGDPRAAVSTVFSWSLRHLPDPAVDLFRLLGLHPGETFDTYAAAALADGDLAGTGDVLDVLVQAHLVQPAEHGRYRMHDLVRAYAIERAVATDPAPARRAALTRLFDYYLATAARAMDLLSPAETHRRPRIPPAGTPAPTLTAPDTARAWLDSERATMTAVATHTATHGWPTHTTRLSATLFRYLLGGHHVEALTIHGHARRTAERVGDESGQANALSHLGAAHLQMARHEPAAEQFREALGRYERIGDLTGQARVLANLGIIEERQGRYDSAIVHHEEALRRYRTAGDRHGEAAALLTLGVDEHRVGRYLSAVDRCERAIALFREIGDRHGLAATLNSLSLVEQRLGRYDSATGHLDEALSLYRQLGNRSGESATLDSLGSLYTLIGQPKRAAEQHRQALAILRETGDRYAEACALNGLGEAALAGADPAGAREHHEAAHAAATETGGRAELARAHAGLGQAHRELGDHGQAREHYRQALTIHIELGTAEADRLRQHLAELDD